jgi:hypothetical protein
LARDDRNDHHDRDRNDGNDGNDGNLRYQIFFAFRLRSVGSTAAGLAPAT